MTDLIIIRGLPGSGKSTLAKMLVANAGYYHHEADHFFNKEETAEYVFCRELLPQAHDYCMRNVHSQLIMGNKVVVSNTFSQRWEYMRYVDLANKLNKSFSIIVCTGGWKNIHGVPEEAINKMIARWEK